MADEGKQKYTAAQMQKWLFEKAAQSKDARTVRKIVMSNNMRGRASPIIGRLYFFKYNPIGRLTLPQYDKFPMVVPIEHYNNGFLGLNLHYLPAGSREGLLELLLSFRSEQVITDRTRMKVNYTILKSMKKLERLSAPCIHRYLFTQVRSKFIEVYPSEFDIAINLPTEDWVFNQ